MTSSKPALPPASIECAAGLGGKGLFLAELDSVEKAKGLGRRFKHLLDTPGRPAPDDDGDPWSST